MKDAITSANHWLSENLPGVTLEFAPGKPVIYPAITISTGEISEVSARLNPSVRLVRVEMRAACWSEGEDAAAARGLAEKVKDILLGDTDRGVRIPRYEWDYDVSPPVIVGARDEMAISGVKAEEVFLEEHPELRLIRVTFELRVALSG